MESFIRDSIFYDVLQHKLNTICIKIIDKHGMFFYSCKPASVKLTFKFKVI